RLAASAERGSEHPLAQAVIQRAREQHVETTEPREFKTVMGEGVIASVDGTQVVLGNRKLMNSHGVNVILEPTIQELEAEGKTVMLLAVDNTLEAAIALADSVRDEAPEVIAQLQNMGINTAMVTGDNHTSALAVAKRIGISTVRHEVRLLAK
ncbi:MAG: HAD-IC family P-type ATPase, partial [Halobacteriota archaeon]